MKHGLITRIAVLAGCVALSAAVAQAQAPISNLIVTVGTTIQDSSGNNWSYILLGSPQPQLLEGKQFAIYAKPGPATNTGTYTFRGNIFQQTDPNAINALLNQSVALGENLTTLSETLNTLLHGIPGITNETLAQKVLSAFQAAGTNANTGEVMGLVAHVNPGLTLCSGQAFSEEITTTTTYEVREINLGTSVAGEVVGQVTIIPGNPITMPAPGYPFQVITNAPSDNLRIRLRWGTSVAYRRVALLGYGFNVWRIASSNAVSEGYNTTPPTTNQLYTDPNITMANYAPVMATKDFTTGTGTGAANDPADGTTYFFSDTNQVQVALGNPPFTDGEEFYYFITARDVLGRDGAVSPGGTGMACRKIPPATPTGVAVKNVYHVVSPTNQQALMVTWQQDLNPTDMVNQYWIYRWQNPAQILTNGATPSNGLIGIVTQFPGSPTNSYTDNGPTAPLTPGLSNYWYTVRAESTTACGPLLSPDSMQAWGVLRERFGPPGTTGEVIGSCGTPTVVFQEFADATNNGNTPDYNNWNYNFICQRSDPGTAWVEFLVTNESGLGQVFGPVYFPPSGDTVLVSYSAPSSTSSYLTSISCVAGTYYGLDSLPSMVTLTSAPPADVTLDTVFLAGEVMLTSLSSSDPLAAGVFSQGNCLPAVGATAYPDGTVRMRFDTRIAEPLFIQALSGAVTYYAPPTDIGVAYPDAEGYYTVYYPECLLGPLPEFQGCPINLRTDGTCTQHVSGGAPGSPVNPIKISFALTPRTYEYRLYRSVNNGPLTMIAQDAAMYDPSDPYKSILITDDTMPPSVARLCYYVELLDEHGNGGPMTLLGCKDVKPPTLPRPVLAAPLAVGDLSNPQVALNWFCPTSGVYRFQVMIQRDDHPGGGVPLGFTSTQLSPLVSYNTSSSFVGLIGSAPFALERFDGAMISPPTESGFGPGPQFMLTASVLTNVPYDIAVAAVDDEGNAGEPSQVWTFTWKPTNALPTVPWPSRPLPPVNPFDDAPVPGLAAVYQPRVEAVLMNGDQTYPAGVRIGNMSTVFTLVPNIGNTNFVTYEVQQPVGIAYIPPSPNLNPNNFLFKRFSPNPGRNGNPILPICLYRQQVANASYPRVTGALVQVSPLLEQLAYGDSPATNGEVTVTIYDRLIAAGLEGKNRGMFLYLRDQQPMLQGAAYQYFVARFNDQHEIAELIPAGTLTIPVYLP
ncbi:MAG TPA: hypothetical protein VH595_01345 [Verrucomicrobiae bacterium]|jgi:hypothetical protein|nr:hypothetical protein [Verrucomicrobiae bacterium]